MEDEKISKSAGKGGKALLVAVVVIVVAILVVYVGRFYPPIGKEEAAGTVGAVKKYHVQQISDKDVVLAGQEAETAHAQAAQFLNDAAKLQNIGVQLANMEAQLRSQQAEAQVSSRLQADLVSLDNSLKEVSNALQSRAVANMKEWQSEVSNMLQSKAARVEGEELASMKAEMAEISNRFSTVSAKFGSADFENIANRLSAISLDMQGRIRMNAVSVDQMKDDLELANAQLASRSLDSAFLVKFSGQLANYAGELASRKPLQHSVDAYAIAANSYRMEASLLAKEDAELGKKVRGKEELQSELGHASQELMNEAYTLEQQTLQGLKADVLGISAEENSLANLESALELANRTFTNHAAALEQKPSADLQQRFAGLKSQIAENMTVLEHQMVGSMQGQMSMLGTFLENSHMLQQRDYDYLQAYMTDIGSRLRGHRDALEQRTIDSCEAKLRAMADQLQSKIGNRATP